MSALKLAMINAFGRTARAGLRAAQSAPAPSKKRRKAKAICTPCEAMAQVDAARERVSGGSL